MCAGQDGGDDGEDFAGDGLVAATRYSDARRGLVFGLMIRRKNCPLMYDDPPGMPWHMPRSAHLCIHI